MNPNQSLAVRIARSVAFRARRYSDLVLRYVVGDKRALELKYYLVKGMTRDAGYGNRYYEFSELHNTPSYTYIAKAVTKQLGKRSLVDVGCGNGGISAAFVAQGCSHIAAFDYSASAVQIAQSRGLNRVERLDITTCDAIPAQAELCVCIEVAEHLPERFADHLCQLLTPVAPVLVFTAAPPGQGGRWHLNEQPREYWILRFESLGMHYDEAATTAIRGNFNEEIVAHYSENLMVFKRGQIVEAASHEATRSHE